MQSTPSEPAQSDSTIIRTGSDGRLRYSPAQRKRGPNRHRKILAGVA